MRPFTAAEKQELSEYFPATESWERGLFYTQKIHAPYYFARASRERAVVIGCSGLNTHYLLDPDDVKKLNDHGISVIWMALPKIEDGKPMIDLYTNLAKDFFTSPASPASMITYADVPRFALTHSTGGLLFMKLLHMPDANRKLTQAFSGAVHVAPYYDTAHASRDHAHPWSQKIFQKYMGWKPHIPPSDRLVSSLYIKLNDMLDPHGDNDHPGMGSTCGQILELQAAGRKLTATFNVRAASAIPAVFIIGQRDNFACPLTAADIANKIDAEIIHVAQGFHDPLQSDPSILDQCIRKMDICIAKHERSKAQVEYVTPRANEEKLYYIGLLDELRDRSRFALQRGASFLNAAARFF